MTKRAQLFRELPTRISGVLPTLVTGLHLREVLCVAGLLAHRCRQLTLRWFELTFNELRFQEDGSKASDLWPPPRCVGVGGPGT